MQPERRNTIKVLLFFDIGGSMDRPHPGAARSCSAPRAPSSRTWSIFYFHNCLYESVWKDNRRRWDAEKLDTWDLLNTYPHDYKVIFVGDATMSPYEITYPGGSVEHWNEEPGAVWMDRVTGAYKRRLAQPDPERDWDHTPSIGMMRAAHGRADVPVDAGRVGARDARAGAVITPA